MTPQQLYFFALLEKHGLDIFINIYKKAKLLMARDYRDPKVLAAYKDTYEPIVSEYQTIETCLEVVNQGGKLTLGQKMFLLESKQLRIALQDLNLPLE